MDKQTATHSLLYVSWYHFKYSNFLVVFLEELFMLNITKTIKNKEADFALEGRLNTVTAPELEKELKTSLDGITELRMDFEKLDYISSAGLRVLLSAQKQMNKQGTMTLHHVNQTILEIFEVTGFSDILTVE